MGYAMSSIPPERSLHPAPAPSQTPRAVPPGAGQAALFFLATSMGSLETQPIISRQPESLEGNECFRVIHRVCGVMRMSTAVHGGGCLQYAGAADLELESCGVQMLLCPLASVQAWGHPGKVTQGTKPGGCEGTGCTLKWDAHYVGCRVRITWDRGCSR